MKKWWCHKFHWKYWWWKSFSWGETYCGCGKCGRQWIINKNIMVKE